MFIVLQPNEMQYSKNNDGQATFHEHLDHTMTAGVNHMLMAADIVDLAKTLQKILGWSHYAFY